MLLLLFADEKDRNADGCGVEGGGGRCCLSFPPKNPRPPAVVAAAAAAVVAVVAVVVLVGRPRDNLRCLCIRLMFAFDGNGGATGEDGVGWFADEEEDEEKEEDEEEEEEDDD